MEVLNLSAQNSAARAGSAVVQEAAGSTERAAMSAPKQIPEVAVLMICLCCCCCYYFNYDSLYLDCWVCFGTRTRWP